MREAIFNQTNQKLNKKKEEFLILGGLWRIVFNPLSLTAKISIWSYGLDQLAIVLMKKITFTKKKRFLDPHGHMEGFLSNR